MRDLNKTTPELLERAIAAACYLSCGLVGLVYILFSGKNSRSPFFRFHFIQSIVIGLLTYLLSWIESILKDILAGISGLIFGIIPQSASIITIFNNGIDLLLFLITKLAFLLIIYGCLFALLGKYAEIPGISRLVYRQL